MRPLTPREREVLVRLPLPRKVIAEQLGIAPSTVKCHTEKLYAKLDVPMSAMSTRWAAIDRAIELGLITEEELIREAQG
jgi:DNA-binding NarL/FixJ family response regulator